MAGPLGNDAAGPFLTASLYEVAMARLGRAGDFPSLDPLGSTL